MNAVEHNAGFDLDGALDQVAARREENIAALDSGLVDGLLNGLGVIAPPIG